MPQITSGSVLRETRERKNYDLNTVARRLRIRPDILRAIEASDFAAMPPRGYTRNMVNAYARFLGLNPTEIVDMYLDEAYAYQVERARSSAPSSGFVMEGSYQRRPRVRTRTGASTSSNMEDRNLGYGRRGSYSSYFEPIEEDPPVQTGYRKRHLYDDSTRYAHDEYGVKRESIKRPGRSERDFLSHHSGYESSYETAVPNSYRQQTGSRRSRDRSIHVGQTPMQYSAPRFAGLSGIFQSRVFLIVAVAVVVLIIALIIFFVVGNRSQNSTDDVSQLPVSGISDTTGTSEGSKEAEAPVEIAPTSARVTYSVKAGDDCYVEIYKDGTLSQTEMLSGPVNESVEVTGTWTVTTWSGDTIEVTVDGEPVKLTSNEEYGGMYAYTVDFPKMLEEWNSTHNSKSSQRQAAVASASAAKQAGNTDEEDEGSQSTSQSSSASSSSSAQSANQ